MEDKFLLFVLPLTSVMFLGKGKMSSSFDPMIKGPSPRFSHEFLSHLESYLGEPIVKCGSHF